MARETSGTPLRLFRQGFCVYRQVMLCGARRCLGSGPGPSGKAVTLAVRAAGPGIDEVPTSQGTVDLSRPDNAVLLDRTGRLTRAARQLATSCPPEPVTFAQQLTNELTNWTLMLPHVLARGEIARAHALLQTVIVPQRPTLPPVARPHGPLAHPQPRARPGPAFHRPPPIRLHHGIHPRPGRAHGSAQQLALEPGPGSRGSRSLDHPPAARTARTDQQPPNGSTSSSRRCRRWNVRPPAFCSSPMRSATGSQPRTRGSGVLGAPHTAVRGVRRWWRWLVESDASVLPEVGSGQTFVGLARRALAAASAGNVTITASPPHSTDSRGAGETMRRTLGRLWLRGVVPDWAGYHGQEKRAVSPCPPAPSSASVTGSNPRSRGVRREPGRHPLLEHVLFRSTGQTVFRTELSLDRHWVLAEHHVLGAAIVPSTTYLEMCRAAATPHPGAVSDDTSLTRRKHPQVIDFHREQQSCRTGRPTALLQDRGEHNGANVPAPTLLTRRPLTGPRCAKNIGSTLVHCDFTPYGPLPPYGVFLRTARVVPRPNRSLAPLDSTQGRPR